MQVRSATSILHNMHTQGNIKDVVAFVAGRSYLDLGCPEGGNENRDSFNPAGRRGRGDEHTAELLI
jgi:hypothetical protein